MGNNKDQNRLTAAAEQCRFEEVRARVESAGLDAAWIKEASLLSAHDHEFDQFEWEIEAAALHRAHEAVDAEQSNLIENRKLAENLQTRADFLANMSHELRSPLNSVIGFSEVLLEQMCGSINEKQAEYVKHILASGLQLLALITDIIDLSTVEAGPLELELGDVSLHATLDGALAMHREKALKSRITLHMDLAPEADVRILADQGKLKRIMFTLLANAVKFTPAGGSVNVSALRDGDFIEITVADTGLGIKVENIPKVFQASPQQLQAADTGKAEDIGPGLVLIRQLVELHGGRIWVKSFFGMGSRFSFTLPLSPAEIVAVPACRADNLCGAGKTVLLIEDEKLTLAATEHALHDKGYRVLRAKDGETGLEMARRAPLDLIILDIMLPGINGFDVVERLRNEQVAENVPILILTSMKILSVDRERLAGKVWRIAGKGSLSTHEFINLVESAVGSK